MCKGNGGTLKPLIWKLSLVFGSLLVVSLVLVACSSMTGSTASGMSKVTVSLSDPATCQAPSGPFSAVWVTVTDVSANTSATAGDSDSGWVDLTPNLSKSPAQVNLLGQSNAQCFLATLGDPLELQAGNYQQIRIKLAPNSGTVFGNNCGSANNCVILNGDSTPHTLQLSSEAQTGLKIPSGQIAGGGFNVAAGKTEDLDIDFNTCMSILQEGNGQFRLKPVLHAAEVTTTSVSMNGTVLDAAGHAVAGAVVAIEQPDGSKDADGNPIDRFLVATTTDASGSWVICPVTEGDPSKPYDLVVVGSTSDGVLFAPSVVTGINVGSTAGTVTLNASTTLNTAALSTATITGQITSTNATNTGQAIDVNLSVLETINKVDYTIPLSATATQTAGAGLTVTTAATANGTPACPTNTDCYNYTLQTEANGAYIGAWSANGATLAQPVAVPVYSVDGNASTTGTSTPTANCTPSEQISSAIALTGSPLAGTANLAFKSCQ